MTTVDRLAARALVGLVRAYQVAIRPLIGSHCRHEPHCSAYAVQALHRHGAVRGVLLTTWRLARCNPWCACGHDPVPPAPTFR